MNSEKHDEKEDQQLLENFYRDRNNEWLGILLQRYTLLLFGVCMKYLKNEEDARDSVQQIFLKSITELHKYKVDYFKSWIYMVAKNHCLMKLRDKQGKIPVELTENHITTPEETTDRQDVLNDEITYELMNNSLEELNKEQKRCVTLFYLEKKSYNEVSEITGYSTMQVKSHIQNGKRNLKNILEKKLKEQDINRSS